MAKTVIKANIERFGPGQLILNVDPNQLKWLADFKGMDLTVEFKPYKSQRSLNQNALLWSLISEIDLAENGRPSEQGEMSIYANLIKMAKVSTAQFETTREAYDEMKRRKLFRHIEVLSGGDKMVWVGYYGSSTFDTAEMNLLIETAKDYASKLNIFLED